MCLSLYTDDSSGQVCLDGFLSSAHNTSGIDADQGNVKRVVAYRDTGSDRLKRGRYGIGSVGCQAGFGNLYTHEFNDASDYTRGINLSVRHDSAYHGCTYAEWDY